MITDFNILNPKIDTKMPFYNKKNGIFYFHTDKRYNYFIEASRYNENNILEYFILCGKDKFDNSCKKCHIDNYNRCQIRPLGKIKEYIQDETEERGNIICNLYEERGTYDIYKLE